MRNHPELTTVVRFLLMGLVTWSAVKVSNAQPVVSKNLVVRYYQVPSENAESFKEEWLQETKKAYQEAVEKDILNAVYLTEVWYPKGKQSEYQFVTLEIFENFDQLDSPIFKSIDQHPRLLKKDILGVGPMMEVNQDTIPLSAAKVGHKLYIDLMKVNTSLTNAFSNYFSIENAIWKPVHEARMEKGFMHSWAIATPWFDDAIDDTYDVLAINGYGSLENFMKGGTIQLSDVHPGKDISKEVLQPTNQARKWLKGQWWEVVDLVR